MDSFSATRDFTGVNADLGGTGTDQVRRLLQYVERKYGAACPMRTEAVRVRTAPSLITRSETFMLGIPSPRFAIRMAIDNPESGKLWGFVNLRRMARFVDEVSRSDFIHPPHMLGHPISWLKSRRWRTLLAKGSCVADGLFSVPERYLRPDWHILSAPRELAQAYGEDGLDRTIPYLKHIDFVGGGMCAHACCFMASALAYRSIATLHSIGDISYLASHRDGEDKPRSFTMTGLREQEILSYFDHSHSPLRASCQSDSFLSLSLRSQPPQQNSPAYTQLALAIKAYIRSGFPIIFPLDKGRMEGGGPEGIQPVNVYRRGGVTWIADRKCPARRIANRCHAVLAIGCREHAGTLDVLINDPAEMPFIEVSLLHLLHDRPYDSTASKPFSSLAPVHFLPIVPKKVHLPLLNEKRLAPGSKGTAKEGKWEVYSGLCSLADGIDLPDNPLRRPDDHFQRAYHLLAVGELTHEAIGLPGIHADSIAKQKESLVQAGWDPGHYIWVQKTARSYAIIWDAERAPPRRECHPVESERFLREAVVAIGTSTTSGLVWTNPKAPHNNAVSVPSQRQAIQTTTGGRERLRPSLITSFSGHTLKEMLTRWPKSAPACELYMFLYAHARDLLPDFRQQSLRDMGATAALRYLIWMCGNWVRMHPPAPRDWMPYWFTRDARQKHAASRQHLCVPLGRPQLSIRDWLASRSNDMDYIERVASAIAESFSMTNVPLTAVCTFMPGLTCNGSAHGRSVRALIFIHRLCAQLNRLTTIKSAIGTIVTAAGSVIQSVRWARGGSRRHLFSGRPITQAQLMPRQDAWDNLLRGLRSVYETTGSNILTAIELEPSSLSAVSCLSDLKHIARLVERDSVLRDKVGFNYDATHWSISAREHDARELDWLASDLLASKVYHAHISDSGRVTSPTYARPS